MIKKSVLIFFTLFIFPLFNFCYAQGEILSVSQIVDKCGKAVVLIATSKETEDAIGVGSGFIVDPKGIIVTNYHVIEGAFPALVKLINGDIYDDIAIIDTDARRDIAVLKIKGYNLPTIKFGDSSKVKVGEQIIVIGNPQGLENTVTDGLVSGFRDFGEGYKLHQISAPISPGSSGSPVFNNKGEVIGIATSSIVDGQNLNFSLPINYVRGLISEETKMSLEEFSKKTTAKATPPALPPLPPPKGALIIPPNVRSIMYEGLNLNQNRYDFPIVMLKHLYLPAGQTNLQNIFIFQIENTSTSSDNYAFFQFYRLTGHKPPELVKEVYAPANIQINRVRISFGG
jgi:S1-C subfamily serine protease